MYIYSLFIPLYLCASIQGDEKLFWICRKQICSFPQLFFCFFYGIAFNTWISMTKANKSHLGVFLCAAWLSGKFLMAFCVNFFFCGCLWFRQENFNDVVLVEISFQHQEWIRQHVINSGMDPFNKFQSSPICTQCQRVFQE